MRVLVGFLTLEARGIVNASENKTALSHIKIHFMENEIIWLTREEGIYHFIWLMNNP